MTNDLTIVNNYVDLIGPKLVLMPGVSVEKFVIALKTALAENPDIVKKCKTPAGKNSLYIACQKAAKDGLVLDGRQAALVPYGDKFSYQPMAEGKRVLLERAGHVSDIRIEIIYSNDEYSRIFGSSPSVTHKPAPMGQRGNPIGGYGIAYFKDGSQHFEEMEAEQILKIGDASKNKHQYQLKSPHWAEWWRKTLMHRLWKYVFKESAKSALDDEAANVEQDFEGFSSNAAQGDPDSDEPPMKKRGAAAAAIKAAEEQGEQPNDDIVDAEFAEITEDDQGRFDNEDPGAGTQEGDIL